MVMPTRLAHSASVSSLTGLPKYFSEAEPSTVHEMARDEARHGKAFAGLLKRYFG